MYSLESIIKQNKQAEAQGIDLNTKAVGTTKHEPREYGTVFGQDGNVLDQGLTRVEALHQYGPTAVWVKN